MIPTVYFYHAPDLTMAGSFFDGQDIPAGWLPGDLPAPPAPSLDQLRTRAITALKIARDARVFGVMVWDGSGFDVDAIAQSRILGMAVTAQSAPGAFPIDWRLADNTWRSLSAADAGALFGALQAHIAGLFAAFKAHETAVTALTDAAEIAAYPTTATWP
jgi:hypothetical protein